MKKKLIPFTLFVMMLSMFALIACNGSNDLGINPTNNNNAGPDRLPKTAKLKKQMQSMAAAGVDVDEVDVIFSLGWYPSFDFENKPVVFSDGFAIAINNEAFTDTTDQPYSLDMGDVKLHYASNIMDFFKFSYAEWGEVFYSAFNWESDTDEPTEIPFLANETYRFEATGTDKFAPLSMSITAPSAVFDLTSPENEATHDKNEPLTLTWAGGQAGDSLYISVWSDGGYNFTDDSTDYPDSSAICGDSVFVDYEFDQFFVDEMVDSGDGQYTIPSEKLKELLGESDKAMLFVDLYKLQFVEETKNGLKAVVEVHTGDFAQIGLE